MIQVDVRGIIGMLTDLETSLGDAKVKQIMEGPVADAVRADLDRQFFERGDPKWTPLTLATIKQKIYGGTPRLTRKGLGNKYTQTRGPGGGMVAADPSAPLIRTSDLRYAWTNKKSPDHSCEYANGQLVISPKDTLFYWHYHQSPKSRRMSRKGKPRLPYRPVVLSENLLKTLSAILVQELVKR